ncbi:hypothetical protein ACFWAT_00260 [Streptomyces syringium]|uniref:hypothetical protein n=1 Tax=Streptomyces syringium TaxID=76729 RepID=UPI0036684F2D
MKFGDRATVEGDRSGSVGVTVVRVEEGSNADLSGLENPSKYEGKTPFYVRFKLTKTAEGNDNDESSHFEVSKDGKRLTELMVFTSFDATGDPSNPLVTRAFERCESADHTKYKEAAERQSVEGCAIFLATEGAGAPSTEHARPVTAPSIFFSALYSVGLRVTAISLLDPGFLSSPTVLEAVARCHLGVVIFRHELAVDEERGTADHDQHPYHHPDAAETVVGLKRVVQGRQSGQENPRSHMRSDGG